MHRKTKKNGKIQAAINNNVVSFPSDSNLSSNPPSDRRSNWSLNEIERND
jgi:hypothetical protein